MSNNNVFAIAYKYHTLGRCAIPSGDGPDGKAALVQWKRYQREQPTDVQLQEWQSKAIQVWEAEEKPIIHLGPGENRFDLEKLLSNSSFADHHLEAVKEWLCSRVTKAKEN